MRPRPRLAGNLLSVPLGLIGVVSSGRELRGACRGSRRMAMRFCVREGLPGTSILSSSTALTRGLAGLLLHQAPSVQAVPEVLFCILAVSLLQLKCSSSGMGFLRSLLAAWHGREVHCAASTCCHFATAESCRARCPASGVPHEAAWHSLRCRLPGGAAPNLFCGAKASRQGAARRREGCGIKLTHSARRGTAACADARCARRRWRHGEVTQEA